MLRRFFRPRRLIALLALFAGLFVAADIVFLRVAQSRLASGVAQAVAAEGATSTIGRFPFLLDFFGGETSPFKVEVVGASASGIRVDHVVANAEKISFNASKAFSLIRSPFATKTPFVFTNIEVRVTIIERDLTEYARPRTEGLTSLRITSGGIEAIFALPDGTLSPPARLLPAVVDNKIVLRLTGRVGLPDDAVERAEGLEGVLDLPAVPAGFRPDVELENGRFIVSLKGTEVVYLVGRGGQ